MFSFKANRSDVFLLIWVLYYMQGTLYSSPMINRFLQLIMVIWLFVVFLFVIMDNKKPKLIKAMSALFIMYLVYGLWNILFGSNLVLEYQIPTYFYLQKAINSILPILLFYYYSCKGYVTENRIRVYFFVLLVLSLVLYNKESLHMYERASIDQTGITNNAGYGMIALIPMVYYFYKKPIVQYTLLAFLLSLALLGAKRGAILIGGICLLYYIIVSFRRRKNRFYAFLLGSIFLIIAFYYIEYAFSTNEYLSLRLERTMEGDSSQRDVMYGTMWGALLNESSVINVLFGRGADSTVKYFSFFAHQDWLEIAFNNGIVGVFLFIMFFVNYIIEIKNARHCLPNWQLNAFVTILIIGLLKSIFSAFITQIDLCISIVIGYTLAQMINSGRIENNRIIQDATPKHNSGRNMVK